MRIKVGLFVLGIATAIVLNGGELSTNQVPPLDIILKATKPQSGWFDLDKQPIFKALAELAKAQGQDPTNFTRFRCKGGFAIFSGGAYSRKIKSGDGEYVIVVETVESMSIPGTSAQQLVLLDKSAKILDRFQCHINSRYGKIMPHVQDQPETDGTQICLRFDGGGNYWHNWHTIIHGDVEKTFRDWNETEPNEWDRNGLVRIAVSGGQFRIIWPDMNPARDHQEERPHNRQ